MAKMIAKEHDLINFSAKTDGCVYRYYDKEVLLKDGNLVVNINDVDIPVDDIFHIEVVEEAKADAGTSAMSEPIFNVAFGKHNFTYQFGSEAYIFHAGIFNNIHKKYGIKDLQEYVTFVQQCYLSDDNPTPLGSLADYIAVNWKKIKNKGRSDVLAEFYEEEIFC